MTSTHEIRMIMTRLRTDIMHDIILYTHASSTHMLAQKRLVRITLDVECYDDLDLDSLDWKDLLDLEGDEDVDVSIKDLSDIF